MLAAGLLDHLIDRSLVIQKARRNEFKDKKRWDLINKGAVDLFETAAAPHAYEPEQVAEDRYELERVMTERGTRSTRARGLQARIRLSAIPARQGLDKSRSTCRRCGPITTNTGTTRSFQQTPQSLARDRRPLRQPSDAAPRRRRRPSRRWPGSAGARISPPSPESSARGQRRRRAASGRPPPAATPSPRSTRRSTRMKPGELSPIIEGPTGLHIVRLESHRRAGRMSFEEVQNDIRDISRPARKPSCARTSSTTSTEGPS